MITRHEIDVSRQNKVKYVVNDVVDLFHNMMVPQDEEFVFDDVIAQGVNEILLRRGVYKWLAVRRDLIRYKHTLKDLENVMLEHTHLIKAMGTALGKEARHNSDYLKLRSEGKGILKTMQRIRKDLRAMTHSDRLRAPDNDRMAQDYVNKVLKEV